MDYHGKKTTYAYMDIESLKKEWGSDSCPIIPMLDNAILYAMINDNVILADTYKDVLQFVQQEYILAFTKQDVLEQAARIQNCASCTELDGCYSCRSPKADLTVVQKMLLAYADTMVV